MTTLHNWVMSVQRRVHHSSKHCRACDKCVTGFDHHCVWLNCCIGERNYLQFIFLLISVFLLLSCQASVDTIMLTSTLNTQIGDTSASVVHPVGMVV